MADPESGIEAIATSLGGDDPLVDHRRAEDLYQRVFFEYGDDSVAQLGGVHLACEQASNILTKVLEWGRLAAYLEQSTRYINYDVEARRPVPLLRAARDRSHQPSRSTYREHMERSFAAYSDLVADLTTFYQAAVPQGADGFEHGLEVDDQGQGLRHRPRVAARLHPFQRRDLRHRPGLRDGADADAGPSSRRGAGLRRR